MSFNYSKFLCELYSSLTIGGTDYEKALKQMKEGQVVICTENRLRFFFLWLMIKSNHYGFTGTQISQKGL